ncbi:nucleotidyltransferase domain-containing protein [Candidatus Micrarchaeota archaeon]|nr:nucleotidyltransferase domain-containing protein [Candidatus Micrarchaeota archaeon]
MQFRNLFVTLFGTKAKAAALQVLARWPEKTWTGRELSKAAGISAPQTGEALREFEKYGLVSRAVTGSASIWSLNQRHVVLDYLKPMAELPQRQKEFLLSEIKKTMDISPIRSIRLFGSMARGDESVSSDVDMLFIVRHSRDKDRIEAKSKDVELHMADRWGNIGAIIVYDRKEYDAKRKLPLVQNIEREGITIYEAA